MRRIAAISAVILVVAAAICLLPAQAQRAGQLRKANVATPLDSINASFVQADERVLALANDFTKALTSAIQEGVINAEQAERMVKELEADFAVKRARIDLLRAASLLNKINEIAADVSETEELQQLRQQLRELESNSRARQEGKAVKAFSDLGIPVPGRSTADPVPKGE